MYKSIITLKKDLTQEKIQEIHDICNKAFDNRAGKSVNTSTDVFVLCFEDKYSPYAGLAFGDRAIRKAGLMQFFADWQFIDDENPNESGNLLEIFCNQVHATN